MKKVLITGAIGFIGSHISENLLEKKYQVIGIDNLSGFYTKKYYSDNLDVLKKYKSFTFHKLNLLDQKKVNLLIKKNGFNYVIHCAAKTNVRKSGKNPDEYLKNNVLGSQILFEAIRQYNLNSKIIVFSSSSVYGRQKKVPFEENMVPNPISPYSLSKYLMEQEAKYYSDIYKLPIVILRPFSIYGPRGRQDMLPSLLLKCIKTDTPFIQYGNNKNNQRDWTYIDDLVDVIVQIISKYDFKSYEVFNIGRSKPVGINSFIRLFGKLIDKKIKINKKSTLDIEMSIVYADISKIKKWFNFKPKINLKCGLINNI